MKVFKNERTENNNELPVRKGTVVPEGAVNLAWHKAPDLNPKNNLIVIDSTKTEGPEKSGNFLAYANMMGILEDEYGDQTWPEEFPIVGDKFLSGDFSTAANILPYVHISRYFHLDYVGLAYSGSLTKLNNQPEIKVVDSNGQEYVGPDGKPRYEIYASNVQIDLSADSRDTAYRLWVFLDTDIEEDDLFLVYHKIEIVNGTNAIRNEQLAYKEPINATEYFRYIPEEAEVVDHKSFNKKIFSSKPIDLKDQIIGKSQPNYKGWRIQVPKKAIPDPRNFELFRWRIACEYSRSVDSQEAANTGGQTKINVGILTFNTSAGASQSRSNYLFHQLNESSFNTGGVKFVNPISEENPNLDPTQAAYWQVSIRDISISDLSRFDILLWSPTSMSVDVGPYLQKIKENFVESKGGTLIFETASRTQFTNLPGVSFSSPLISLLSTPANRVKVAEASYCIPEAATPNSNILGAWNTWPPRLEDIFTNNAESCEILQNLNFLGGWDLNTIQELKPTAYLNSSNAANLSFQYMTLADDTEWDIIVDAEHATTTNRHPILARQKFLSGGSIVVSTGCFFEDHLIADDQDSSGNLLSSTYQINDLDDLPFAAGEEFSLAADSTVMEGEMKLRINFAMLSTAFRPPTNVSDSKGTGYNDDADRSSLTLYSDWQSSWVINAHNNVLDSEEKAKYNFALLPKSPEDPNPVWMRFLSTQTVGEIMDKKAKESLPQIGNFSDWNKRYTILITNPNVETYTYNLINEDTVPAAWTYSFSPPFVVPSDLGPHIIREESVASVGVGEGKIFDDIDRPFKVQSTASYVTNLSENHSINVVVNFSGTIRKTYEIPETTVITAIPPGPYVPGWYVNKFLRWSSDQNTTLVNIPFAPYGGVPQPQGISIWSENHYGRGWVNSWPHWGHNGYYNQYGGNVIVGWNRTQMVQRILNQFIFFGILNGPYIAEDGVYGSQTAWKILELQTKRGAIYIDGVLDAETWSLLGMTLLSLQRIPDWRAAHAGTDMGYWGQQSQDFLQMQNMSSAPSTGSYFKQSWAKDGPSSISEGFLFSFNPAYSTSDIDNNFNVFEVWIKPSGDVFNNSPGVWIDWLDVGNNLGIQGYGFGSGYPGPISVWAPKGSYAKIPFTKRAANSIIFRVRQDTAAGWGTARSFGIDDVAVLAETYVKNSAPPPQTTYVKTVTPGKTVIKTYNISASMPVTLTSGLEFVVPTSKFVKNGLVQDGVTIETVDGSFDSELEQYSSSVTEINLTGYEIVPAYKASSITVTPVNNTISGEVAGQTYKLVYNNSIQTISDPNFKLGPRIGDGSQSFHVKSVGGEVEPFARYYGAVSKKKGILLITDSNGKPFGFPVAAPTTGEGVEANFVRLTMNAWDTDNTVMYGFYDISRKEWVENKHGEPDISYYDYVRRGVQNIYMAVQTSYEIDGRGNLPPASEPVIRPFKLAMPVYGVKTRNEGNIKLRNPSKELSHEDVWPILVGTGSFSKQYYISKDLADSSTTFIKDYPNKTLTAHYLLREGHQGPWSDLLGRPYKDTIDERPRLLSDDTFIVNNSPIASIQEPTLYSTPSDPVTPLFTVYRRETFNGSWTEVPVSDIKEYNLNKGIITLKTPLAEQDNRLVKVTYTSRDHTFHYKYDSTQKVNLNPYIMRVLKDQAGHITALEKPLYVYIKPSFVVENDTKEVVAETHDDKIIGITTSPTIFNPLQADYDPLAYRLGIIFVVSTMDMAELNILDTRVRGGGIQHHLKLSELGEEVKSYWDAPAEQPYSYQQGGFVIVRLPAEITQDFATEEDLRKVIDRNIPAGVAYELQSYAGEPLINFTGSY